MLQDLRLNRNAIDERAVPASEIADHVLLLFVEAYGAMLPGKDRITDADLVRDAAPDGDFSFAQGDHFVDHRSRKSYKPRIRPGIRLHMRRDWCSTFQSRIAPVA